MGWTERGGPGLLQVLLAMFVCFGSVALVATWMSVRSRPITVQGGGIP